MRVDKQVFWQNECLQNWTFNSSSRGKKIILVCRSAFPTLFCRSNISGCSIARVCMHSEAIDSFWLSGLLLKLCVQTPSWNPRPQIKESIIYLPWQTFRNYAKTLENVRKRDICQSRNVPLFQLSAENLAQQYKLRQLPQYFLYVRLHSDCVVHWTPSCNEFHSFSASPFLIFLQYRKCYMVTQYHSGFYDTLDA